MSYEPSNGDRNRLSIGDDPLDRQPEDLFQIGVAARMAGLTVHNLRTWEKRYQVVEPLRTETGRRLYRREDIRRLTVLKELVDLGHAISTLANLQTEQLEKRLAEDGAGMKPSVPKSNGTFMHNGHSLEGSNGSGSNGSSNGSASRRTVIAIGSRLGNQLTQVPGLRIVAQVSGLEDAGDQEWPEADILAVFCPTVFEETVEQVLNIARECRALHCVLVYEFAHRDELQRLVGNHHVTLLRGTPDSEAVRHACGRPVPTRSLVPDWSLKTVSHPIPDRIFTDEQLARISQIASSVQCECPRNLASLLSSLHAFENYSRECENRSPEDAAIHAFLHGATAQARSTMEMALERLVTVEQIKL